MFNDKNNIMKTKNYKGHNILFRGFIKNNYKGIIIRSIDVHRKMIQHLFNHYTDFNNIQCSYEYDRGVLQYTLSCDFKDSYLHLNQDFYTYVNNSNKLKMFKNNHKIKSNGKS